MPYRNTLQQKGRVRVKVARHDDAWKTKAIAFATVGAVLWALATLPARSEDAYGSAAAPTRTPKKAQDAPPAAATKKEIEMGKKEAERLEKDSSIKLLDGAKDPKIKAALDKLNDMAGELGKVSARPLINYQVKVFDDKDINAFTLPNGHIYFSKGLIDFAQSDDELASVLAHEIGHNTRMHVVRGEAKNKPLQWVGIAAMLAMMTGSQAGANVAQMTPYVLTGIANSYSVEYEKEADETAIELMSKTKYNPSALVTFMNRLAAEERRHPEVTLGIYQTHPATPERAAAALKEIQAMGLEYRPRDMIGSREATVKVFGNRASVMWGDNSVIEWVATPAPSSNNPNAAKPVPPMAAPRNSAASSGAVQAGPPSSGKTDDSSEPETKPNAAVPALPEVKPASVAELEALRKRAQRSASSLNNLMRDNLRLYELSVQGDATAARLVGRGTVIASVSAAEATLQNSTPLALAQKWKGNLQQLFWKEVTYGAM